MQLLEVRFRNFAGYGANHPECGTLPLPTRNFPELLALSAGANTEMSDSMALGKGQVTITVNGQRVANKNCVLEGINANDYNIRIIDNILCLRLLAPFSATMDMSMYPPATPPF
jgi:hypothetical protein